jgi:hypothetical protein
LSSLCVFKEAFAFNDEKVGFEGAIYSQEGERATITIMPIHLFFNLRTQRGKWEQTITEEEL